MQDFELTGRHDAWYRDKAYKVVTEAVAERLKMKLDGSEIQFQYEGKIYNAIPLKNWKKILHGRTRQHAGA